MIRAVLEGVSFNLRIILDSFTGQGISIPTIRVIGGGARGLIWRQILADILNRPVERLELLEEATSLGAAVAGAVGVGLFRDFKVAQKIVKVGETHHPRPGLRDLYEKEYEIFQETYNALVPVYAKLQGILKEETR
jgi:xylulokinase